MLTVNEDGVVLRELGADDRSDIINLKNATRKCGRVPPRSELMHVCEVGRVAQFSLILPFEL